MSKRTYHQFRNELIKNQVTCVEEVKNFVSKIENRANLNAFLEVFKEEALERAKQLDGDIQSGNIKPLSGMVVAIKDNICYKNHKVSASSKILENFESQFSATVIQRLLDEGAIIIGRTNCDEFAMGSSNENSAYGAVLNSINEDYVPGGSSGGSAVAVSAGMCHVALGSDTGGSIRQPASFCGVVGFRPSYGRISRNGLLSFASSFDIISPITWDIEDLAILSEVISGKDSFDSTVSQKPVPKYSESIENFDIQNLSISYLSDCFNEGVDIEIQSFINNLIQKLEQKGFSTSPSEFPYLDYVIPVYYVLATAEASSNLSRYSGMIYGHQTKDAKDLEDLITKSRTEGFGAEVKRRIMLGTFVLSEGYYDAYFTKAQKVRRIITDYTEQLLAKYDILILPTAPTTAFRLNENTHDPIAMYLADIFTIQSAIAGVPSISIPIGNHSNGMPFGIQLMSEKFSEEKLLSFSKFLMDSYAK